MNAHELAKILLKGKDVPVVIPALNSINKAYKVEGVTLYQNIDSPFEYCLLLSKSNQEITESEIDVPD